MIIDAVDKPRETKSVDNLNTLLDGFRGQRLWRKLKYFTLALGMFLKVRKEIYAFGVAPDILIISPMFVKTDLYVIYPESLFMKIWYMIVFVLLIYTAIFMPVRFSFQAFFSSTWLIVDTTIDIIFMLDIIINFNTCYYEASGKLVTNRKNITIKYVKGWFWIDLVSSFPIQLFDDSVQISSKQYLRLIRLNRIYRLLSLLKLLRFVKTSYHARKILSIRKNNELLRKFLIFFLVAGVLIHNLGCVWIIISTLDMQNSVNWYVKMQMDDQDISTIYLYAIYYVFTTLTTVGYGDIVPTTIAEKIFAIMLMGFGIGFYSLLIGNLNTLFTSFDEKNRILNSKLSYCQEFAKAISLSETLHKKMKEHIILNADKRFYDISQMDFLKDIPFSLKEKLSSHLHKKFVENIYFFQNKSYVFLNTVIPKLRKSAYCLNDVIYYKDDHAEEIYFINKGRENFKANNKIVFRTYTQGSYFGEIEVIEDCPRENTVIAASVDFEVLMLLKADCLFVFEYFPEIYQDIKCTAEVRKEIHKQSALKVMALKKDADEELDSESREDESEFDELLNRSNDEAKCELLRRDTGVMISVKHDNFEKRRNRALWSCAVEGHPKGRIYKKAKTMKATLEFIQDRAMTPEPTLNYKNSRLLNRNLHNSCFTLMTTKTKAGQAVDILYKLAMKHNFNKGFSKKSHKTEPKNLYKSLDPKAKISIDWVYDNKYLDNILSASYNLRQDLIKSSKAFGNLSMNLEYYVENTKDAIYNLTSSQLYLQDSLRCLELKIDNY